MAKNLMLCVAFISALALGACSGNNASGTPGPGGSSGPDANGDGNGGNGGNGGGNGGNGEDGEDGDAVKTANDRYTNATRAVRLATEAAEAAETETARVEARRLIGLARMALAEAVKAADAAVAAAAGGSAADIGAAARLKIRADNYLGQQTPALDRALGSFAWYGQSLARHTRGNGEAVAPSEGSRDGAHVKIKRIPRTITEDGTVKLNPQAFTSTTFKENVMYETGKKVFSIADDDEGGDEFKVNGIISSDDGVEVHDHARSFMHTGFKLTNDGIVIRTGGQYDSLQFPTYAGGSTADFTDMRRDITDNVYDGFTAPASGQVPVRGHNGWDLELKFGQPHTVSVPNDASRNLRSSWMGNGDFYWRSFVPADPRQLAPDGDYYDAGAFSRPDGYKDLGTYEVWLSNHIGTNRNLEPRAGTVGACRDGSRGTSCPDDDTRYYLKYAAYGLFVYTADRTTYRSGNDGRRGRMQTLHFGYSAFGSDQPTTDIGTEITNATFSGQTLAYAVTGQPLNEQWRDSKLLRGDATLRVSIPKTGNGTIRGDLRNFEEWTGERWRALTSGLTVNLRSTDIKSDGTFSGSVSASPTARSVDFPRLLPSGASNYGIGGGIARDGFSSYRKYQGSFYGPRSDSADLEVAGSWGISTTASMQWDLHGSFAAKQKPDS